MLLKRFDSEELVKHFNSSENNTDNVLFAAAKHLPIDATKELLNKLPALTRIKALSQKNSAGQTVLDILTGRGFQLEDAFLR